MIPAYNRTTYLERTLASVLAQDPGAAEMEIAVVDDASTVEDPEPLVRRVGGERVAFIRQPRNLGQFANVNNCLERARGECIHLLHSDDVVYPGFYGRLRAGIESRPEVGAAFCRHAYIQADDRRRGVSNLERAAAGILPDLIDRIGITPMTIQCAAIVVRRRVYEQVGGFRLDLESAGDWEMWVRVAASFPVWYEPEVLAAWRQHLHSVSGEFIQSGEVMAHARRCIEISHAHLPPARADAITQKSREWLALASIETVKGCLAMGEFTAALCHLYQGMRGNITLRVLKALILLPYQVVRGGVRRALARNQPARG